MGAKFSKIIFITGGVVSSLGKGLAAASLASLLQQRGYKVRLKKLDPYLNIDPGTMSPFQHGEVFVTEDGAETDLDLGHYERFTGVNAKKGDNVTAGKIYSKLLTKERKGDYLGATVQVIPHVTDLINEYILDGQNENDFILCEIGGTVGDIEALPFFEAIRQVGYKLGKDRVMYMHLTLLPFVSAAEELKTKPTQHSVKELRSIGIQPDILLCRSEHKIPKKQRQKIGLFCNIPEERVIAALDVPSIYTVPIEYHKEGLDVQVCKHFNLPYQDEIDLSLWQDIIDKIELQKKKTTIAIVGKYIDFQDCYKSIVESIHHAEIAHGVKAKVIWVSSDDLNDNNIKEKLGNATGVLVPGGFGGRGSTGKIAAIKYARENNVPFFGICFGMQLATIEFARNVCKIEGANSTELEEQCTNPIVGLMTQWDKEGETETRGNDTDIGGTMRLGSYPCVLNKGSLAAKVYGEEEISERHRHRFEANIEYKEQLESKGLKFSGMSPDGKLPEIIELEGHKFFLACQFHPEFKSRPFAPHPIFSAFVKATVN